MGLVRPGEISLSILDGDFLKKILAISFKRVYNIPRFPRMWTFWNKPTCHALSAFWIKTIGV